MGKKFAKPRFVTSANWKPNAVRTEEIPFVVARIVLQDFTGVPLLVDLAAMRSAVARLGKNVKLIEPLVPVDLVVDHSVQVDYSGTGEAFKLNMQTEFQRNRARYQFLKWGMQAFESFKVVPPGIGIVHQVNLEYLAKGVLENRGVYYPDTLVGTDSHTTMINGLGIVGWGVGGIEAEAGMLGQPVYFLTPDVVGVHLTGALREGVTATDLVLHCTEMLRKPKSSASSLSISAKGPPPCRLPTGRPSATWPRNTALPWASSRLMRKPANTCSPRGGRKNMWTRSATISKLKGSSEFPGRASATTAACWNSIWETFNRPWPGPSVRRTASNSRA